MTVATAGQQVSVNLRANVTPYIAAMRQATQATERLNAAIRLTGLASVQAAAQHSLVTTALTAQSAAATASATASASATAATSASATATTAATVAERTRAATLRAVGGAMAGVGAAALIALGIAAVAYARFEKQLSGLQAVTNASAFTMEQFGDAAIEAGERTVFSATEAALAQTELAKVGISTADILGGALAGSLNLAAAGGLELGRSAEIAGQAMKIFNLEGKDVARIADTLANGANQSAADVDQLAQALSQGGLVASQTGLDLEETVGALSAFADNALIGSDAGTSFKSMLQRLTPQSAEAKAEMDRLGISAYDAGGNFIGIEKFAGVLQGRLKGLTTEQRNTSLGIIFGSDAVRAANVLYKEGAEGIGAYIDGVSKVGTAAIVAAIQMDNLAGDVEELRGAFETGLIKSGEESSSMLRDLTQNLTETVRWFNALSPATRESITQMLLVVGVVGVVGGGALILTARFLALRASFVALTASSAPLAAALMAVARAAALLTAIYAGLTIIGTLSKSAEQSVPSLEAVTRALLDLGDAGDLSSLDEAFKNVGAYTSDVDTFGEALAAIDTASWDKKVQQSVAGFLNFDNTLTDAEDSLSQVDQALAALVSGGNADLAATQFDALTVEAERQGISVERLMELLPGYDAALGSTANAQAVAAESVAAMSAEVAGLPPVTEEATAAIDALDATIKRLTGAAFDVENATIAFEASLDSLTESVKENGTSLDLTTQEGRANATALQDQTTKAAGLIQAMANQGATAETLAAKTAALRKQLYDSAIAAGFSKDAANKYASVLDNLPATISSTFLTPGLNAAQQNVNQLISQINKLDGRQVVTTITTRNVVTGRTSVSQVRKEAEGGHITGPGTATSDSIPAMLSDGEYVIKAAAVARYGVRAFDQLNAMRYAQGGPVGPAGGVSVSATANLSPAAVAVLESLARRPVQVSMPGLDQITSSVNGRIGERLEAPSWR